ncbi:MAG TPA: gluconate 2-dehydrogenase subunit 3 family protein [Armatimonadaceae bacterium]|nr:gluconate 2-dehydrogenase subunit 3 family protein [Armatimonadaceae bacterium]
MLDDAQERTLAAVTDRMVPPDDEWPGGVEAGVLDYFREQFARDFAPLVPEYRAGLDALDAEARAASESAAAFAGLPPEAQDALLHRLEQESVAAPDAWGGEPQRAARFVRRLAEHVAEGFYTSPTGRRMVGFEVEPKTGAEVAA